ncbi:hypothetical protein V1512DRAFT_45266 [Lipomyces arxii]|uniref:uncharacterized protein n=1 Tax=Lipomyces arxii TaxID=56418 RepID=UPI0034CEAA41
MRTIMTSPPNPEFHKLFHEFVNNLPLNDFKSKAPGLAAATPTLPASFLSLLSPLLRARLSFNIQSFELGDVKAETQNYDNDRVLETVRHQWAELLTWSGASQEIPELGPILARKLYESKSILNGENLQEFDSESTKVEAKGFARPDEETILASAWLPATGVEVVWCWELSESAWRVQEAKLAMIESDANIYGDSDYLEQQKRERAWAVDLADAQVGVGKVNVANDDDDDSYWDGYDDVDDKKPELSKEKLLIDATVENDVEFYKQYDSVETAVGSELDPKNSELPVHTHIRTSIKSLLQLARDSGVSHEVFMSLLKEGLEV